MNRVKLKHALIDVDFAEKQKTKALIFKFGQLSAWYLTRLILLLSKSTDAIIELDAALQVAQEIGIPNGAEILDYMNEKGMIEISGDAVTQTRVAQDQESLKKDQDSWAEKKRNQRDKGKTSGGHSGDIPETPPGSMNSEYMNNEDLNIDLKKIAKPGFKDLGYGIHLTEIDYQAAILKFHQFGLEEKWMPHAASLLAAWYDKNPTKRSKNGPFLDLVSWAVERCVEAKDKNERRKNTEKIGQKFKDPNEGRPQSASPPRFGDEKVIRHTAVKLLVEDLAKDKGI